MPLLWLSLAFLSGILLASGLNLSAWVWAVLSGVPLLLWLLRFSRLNQQLSLFNLPLPLPVPLLLLALLLGALRYQLAQPDLSDPGFIAAYNEHEGQVALEGVLLEPPEVRERYSLLRLQVEHIRLSGEASPLPVQGVVLARVYQPGEWRYGDRLQLLGELALPVESEDSSYRQYLARQGVYAYLPAADVQVISHGHGSRFLTAVYEFKRHCLAIIERLYPYPEAALLSGILLGVESGIPAPVWEAFNRTGTSHIIVISGFNITILAGLFLTVFGRLLGRWRGSLVAVIVIAVYTVLVGADAAVVRAALMGGLAVFARQVGRRQHGINSLAFIAAVMALFNPLVLWDVSFQLSFAATLGLVLYASPFSAWFVQYASRWIPLPTAQKLAGPFGEYLLFTVAAQITALPLILFYFKRLSLISFIANPFILPAQPLVMILGGLSVVAGLVSHTLGQVLSILAYPFIAYTIRLVEFFAGFPGGSMAIPALDGFWLVLFYGLLALVTFGRDRMAPLLKPGLALIVLVGLNFTVWQLFLAAPDGRLHLVLLDTHVSPNSGEALLLQTPSGRYVLVGGGVSTNRLADALGRRLPLHCQALDWLVVAGSKENQLSALPRSLESCPPAQALWAIPPATGSSARYLRQRLATLDIPLTQAEVGQVLELGDGASLEVLALNSYGAVLLLQWRNFQALLPVGLDLETQHGLLHDASFTPVDVLLLADRGRTWLNPPEWIAHLHPQVVLASVAAGDRDGFPPPETLESLQGYTLLRTDQHGWIHISTDGYQLWVEVEK